MLLIRTRTAIAALALIGLLAGCTSSSDPKAEAGEASTPSPSATPTVNAETWPVFTDTHTGVVFRLPDTPLMYDYHGFDNDGMRQVGSTYWQRHWDAESDLETTIDLTAYLDTEAKSADGKTVLAGFARAREIDGNTAVKLTDVRTSQVHGLDATYGTLTYLTARTEHHFRTEIVQVAGEGWGVIVEVNHDFIYSPASAREGRDMRALLVEVLSYVDFTDVFGGEAATT